MGERTLVVAVADDAGARERGLMGVDDLGGLDGMLFVFPEEVTAGFWMRGTLLPLDVAFFGSDGSPVGVISMTPCRRDPCPVYSPPGPYRYALEVPGGGFSGLGDLHLEVGSLP